MKDFLLARRKYMYVVYVFRLLLRRKKYWVASKKSFVLQGKLAKPDSTADTFYIQLNFRALFHKSILALCRIWYISVRPSRSLASVAKIDNHPIWKIWFSGAFGHSLLWLLSYSLSTSSICRTHQNLANVRWYTNGKVIGKNRQTILYSIS